MTSEQDALLAEFARLRDAVESLQEEEGTTSTDGPAQRETSQAENSTIKAIRAEAKRAEKRAAEAEAELAELRAFKEEATQEKQQAILVGAGLTPRQAEVFLRSFDAVTPENVQVFKSEVLGVREAAEDESGLIDSQPFAPAGFVGERSEKPLTRDDLKKLTPEQQIQAVRDGKVAFRS
jgi:hypothetical protein